MEGYCVKCKAARVIKNPRPIVMKNKKTATSGTCPKCGTKMFRIGKAMPVRESLVERGQGQAVKPSIDGTKFGSITISGELYDHDVVIRLRGDVKKRKKKLSKAKYGTSHVVSLEEAKHIFETGSEQLIVGTGQDGRVELSNEAREFFRRKGCSVQLLPTPQAVLAWNAAEGAAIAMFHVTC
jgi:hypothetical protein